MTAKYLESCNVNSGSRECRDFLLRCNAVYFRVQPDVSEECITSILKKASLAACFHWFPAWLTPRLQHREPQSSCQCRFSEDFTRNCSEPSSAVWMWNAVWKVKTKRDGCTANEIPQTIFTGCVLRDHSTVKWIGNDWLEVTSEMKLRNTEHNAERNWKIYRTINCLREQYNEAKNFGRLEKGGQLISDRRNSS
jgi:hypothetical protein